MQCRWTTLLFILPITMAAVLPVGSNKDYGMLVDQVHVLAKQIQASSSSRQKQVVGPGTMDATTR